MAKRLRCSGSRPSLGSWVPCIHLDSTNPFDLMQSSANYISVLLRYGSTRKLGEASGCCWCWSWQPLTCCKVAFHDTCILLSPPWRWQSNAVISVKQLRLITAFRSSFRFIAHEFHHVPAGSWLCCTDRSRTELSPHAEKSFSYPKQIIVRLQWYSKFSPVEIDSVVCLERENLGSKEAASHQKKKSIHAHSRAAAYLSEPWVSLSHKYRTHPFNVRRTPSWAIMTAFSYQPHQ